MNTQHNYNLAIKCTGNQRSGTSNYKDFEGSYTIQIENKLPILGSSDPDFRWDRIKHIPRTIVFGIRFILSHPLVFTLLFRSKNCSDRLCGSCNWILKEFENGNGKFTSINLNPFITVTENSMIEKATELHKKASEFCFVANSLNSKVEHQPLLNVIEVDEVEKSSV